jgi:CRP-like cAMP-binding protein
MAVLRPVVPWPRTTVSARPHRLLRLSLRSDELVPESISWRIESGYVRANTWNEEGDSITLGLWGPGELIIPTGCELTPHELITLSRVVVEEREPTEREVEAFLKQQIVQTTTLLQINRQRPAEARLFHLLRWIAKRYGRQSSPGASIPFEEMNLTHRHLAEISGMTRVTVTKAISRFRSQGVLVRANQQEWLVPPDPAFRFGS